MLARLLNAAGRFKVRLDRRRLEARRDRLRALGMQLSPRVRLPASTWIDESFCHLISIGDECGFGERCLILAHDAQMNEFLGATRVGRVVIHPSCHIGAGTIILPGVEIGPRTLVYAGSVVSRSLPPDTYCAGAPARPLGPLEEYLERHRSQTLQRPRLPYLEFRDVRTLSPAQRTQMLRAVADGDAYIVTEPIYSAQLTAAGQST